MKRWNRRVFQNIKRMFVVSMLPKQNKNKIMKKSQRRKRIRNAKFPFSGIVVVSPNN